jgi:hypothetical protein
MITGFIWNCKGDKIAMVSPSHNALFETFIQEQKNGLRKYFYYFGEFAYAIGTALGS